jgi:tetratricopeptide (TPR) repeat protein
MPNPRIVMPFIAALLVLLCLPAFAAERAGILVSYSGTVEVRTGNQNWRTPVPGAELAVGDSLRTGANGRAAILLADESLVRINNASLFTLRAVPPRGLWARGTAAVKAALRGVASTYQLDRGEMWIRSNNPDALVDIETPTLSAGIRGTEVNVRVDDQRVVTVSVLEGRVWGRNPYGEIVAETGEQITARPGEPPRKTLLLKPRDAVQWTVPIPDLLPLDTLATTLPPAARTAASAAITDLRGGRVEAAAARTEAAMREFPQQPQLGVLAGVIALYRGDATGAQTRLNALATRLPGDATLWQALALAELLVDDKNAAREAATQATTRAPESTAAWVVSGYVEQAHFDLQAAALAYDRALAINPDDVIALIGKARLDFGSDRSESAWKLAQRAQALAPDNPEVLNLTGFLLLAMRQGAEAITRFEQAIQIAPDLSEPYLGLSIARMREGEQDAAFEAVSTAVALDPGRSLYLSYWGRMLHQVGRIKEAMVVLASAARSDPRDPSPLYYRAVILNDLNRPGEAIDSLHQAIALNDNRAVYRSRFLLDRDLAFRNVDLSYLYGRLGLTAWAEHRALTSVKQDYLNFAGHIFYAGALQGRDERSRGFATEALLGRILQPANINTFNTFNDYTSFFEQPGTSGTVSVGAGNHGTRSGSLFAFHAVPAHSVVYSASLSGDTTDGWRGNNDERNSSAIVRVKWEPTSIDNLTMSLRHNRQSRHDGTIIDGDPFDTTQLVSNQYVSNTFEAGYHRRLGAQTHLLAVASANDIDFGNRDRSTEFFPVVEDVPSDLVTLMRERNNRNSWNTQAMLMHRTGEHQLMGGATWYQARQSTRSVTDYSLTVYEESIPIPELTERYQNRHSVSYANIHVQDTWAIAPDWTVEGALYWEHMRTGNLFVGTKWDINTVSPRLGVAWSPTQRDTLRLATFRYLVPFSFTRLDPADIAGIPVYRAAEEGSLVRESGLMWEHTWRSGFFSAGAYTLKRESVQFFDFGEGRYRVDYHGANRGVEFSLDQIVTPSIGFAARYRHMNVRDSFYADLDRREHLLALGLRWVHPSGYSAGVGGTWRVLDFKSTRSDDTIFIADASVAYEFPGKRGSVALVARNLFDRRFDWVTDQFIFSGRVPAREIAVTLSLNF